MILRPALFLSALLLALPRPAAADVTVYDAEAYETAPGMKVGAALMGLYSDSADRLTGASSPACGRVEIHNMSEDNGIMKMRKVDDLGLPADELVTLSPAGHHLMLMDLKEPLKAGSEFPLTLTFEKGKPVTVKVTVKSRSEGLKKAEEAHEDHGDHSDHDHGHEGHH